MADPYLGELRLMSFSFAPKGWATCAGQQLPINQNQALFALLGTMYGGDGRITFALPDLRGRAAAHVGADFTTQGASFGEEFHKLAMNEMPSHNHFVRASSLDGNQADIGILAGLSNGYSGYSSPTTLSPATITKAGGDQPHENRQPLLVLNWCVALVGTFPSRN
jgi:microcystin-dependent protein